MSQDNNLEEKIPGIDADFKERIEGFSNELRPLLGKYEIGLGSVAELTPDGRVEAKPVFMSSRKPKPEPAKSAEALAEPLSE